LAQHWIQQKCFYQLPFPEEVVQELLQRMISFGSTGESTSHEKHFDVPSSISKIIVGADSDKSVTHTRVLTSMALGLFASKLPVGSWQFVLSPLTNDLMSLSGVQRQV